MEIFIQIQLDSPHFPNEADLSIRDELEEALDSYRGIVVTGIGSGGGVMDIVVAVKRRQPALRLIQQLIDHHQLTTITTITVEERTKAAVRVRAGDLFYATIAPHAYCAGLVLHKSTYFRKCIWLLRQSIYPSKHCLHRSSHLQTTPLLKRSAQDYGHGLAIVKGF